MTRFAACMVVLLVAGPGGRVAARDANQPASLVDAYKKEYAFLEAEKSALTKRIQQFGERAAAQLREADTEVEALQERLLGLRAAADELQMTIDDAARGVSRTEEDADLLGETLGRAVENLRGKGFDLPEPGEDPAAQTGLIRAIFTAAAGQMRRNGEIHIEKGSFFLTDGTRTEGTLVHLGRVASYGISEDGTGALAPAGAGRLKLWPLDAEASALALEEGRIPRTLDLFLYESLDKAARQQEEKSALAVIQSGGFIAWVIAGIGCLAVLLILARSLILLRAGAGAARLVRRLLQLLSGGKREQAEALCRQSKTPAGRVLGTTVACLDRDRQQIEDVVAEAILHEAPGIERFGATILVFAAIAPLLGLLGTVTGIIATFDVITEFGTGDPKLLSGGISEALVTTELGLIVAIPTLFLGTLLRGRANAILAGLERSALALVNIHKRGGDAAPESMEAPPAEDPAERSPGRAGRQAVGDTA